LIGRDAELAELVRFCLDPGLSPYAWWQAGAWAGKSALMSTFVLRPPPELAGRVRIVSFFITARLAAQDTREAFTDALLGQLADLTGQDLPPMLTEATREAHLLDLLAQAAAACQDAGRRLVLVVDGLDEDRGVTTGPDAHSIAGLLPAGPSAGMRVIVSGRPNPPVPDDLPGWHPLRDPAIIRPLTDSPDARDIARRAAAELKRLLAGTEAEQNLLGLLTAARGGLSGSDLEELTGTPLWDIEEILHTVAGRAFSRRNSNWSPGIRPETYLLGHEELQAAAARYLGPRRLASYRERLHSWADAYRAKGWPPGTPEYLLTGYYRLLVTLDDLPRMIVCAGDTGRHDRMLDLTGGDAAALAEVRTAQGRIAVQDVPDLRCALYLAYHRNQLTDRNANIPASLPAVWVMLGQVAHAEALATSIADPRLQAEALAGMARALARTGQHQQAAAVAQQAETATRSITFYGAQARALVAAAGALARTGQQQQAEAAALSIVEPNDGNLYKQAEALAAAAGALAEAGQHRQAAAVAGRAEAVARSIGIPLGQALGLVAAAGALARTGQQQQAEAVASSCSTPYGQMALAAVAEGLADAGQHSQAAAVARRAEAAARSITDPRHQAEALLAAARALARTGQHELAETAARSVTHPLTQVLALAAVAEGLADAGQHSQAAAVARRAEAAALSITDPRVQAESLVTVTRALARTEQQQQAEALARSITDPRRQMLALAAAAEGLAAVAEGLADAGQHSQAAAVARRVEAAARSITDSEVQAESLVTVTRALAGAGQHQQAETAARSITHPRHQAHALLDVARALAGARHYRQAEVVARSITRPDDQATALVTLAGALAGAGQHRQAEVVARSITAPDDQATALAAVTAALAKAGQHRQAAAVARQAEAAARSITDSPGFPKPLVTVVGLLAGAGQHRQAAAVARRAEALARVTASYRRAEALAGAAEAQAAAGQHQRAAAVARQARAAAQSVTSDPYRHAEALTAVAEALTRAGQHQQAETVVRSITDPDRRDVALRDVAEALTRAGQHQQAETLVRSITDPDDRAEALVGVARVLAGAGQHQQAAAVAGQAEAAARSIAHPRRQAHALATLAELLAGAGRHQQAAAVAGQAEAAARSVTDPYDQAWALARVAETMAGAGDTRASRVAAATCMVGHWAIAVQPVLLLDPSAFTVLAFVLTAAPADTEAQRMAGSDRGAAAPTASPAVAPNSPATQLPAGTSPEMPLDLPSPPSPPTAAGTWTAVVTVDSASYQGERAERDQALDAILGNLPAHVPERRFRLSGTEARIGRRLDNPRESDINLKDPIDPGMSALHAMLIAGPDRSWSIVDPPVPSTNGIMVNGTDVRRGQAVPLRDGDRIYLGSWTVITIIRS
jgi:tetratricopeptide (TPR) repeat protein